MKVVFIRHGKTLGNIEKRYIGRTDESLCEIGKAELMEKAYPTVDFVICSPMKRCIETAGIIYPDISLGKYEDLRECDFGEFEGKNYVELNNNTDYQSWIDSGGTLPFPKGENTEQFKKRCINAFRQASYDCMNRDTIAFIVHGGTIMSILEEIAVPHKNYYDYQIKNGNGYLTEYDGKTIQIIKEI